MTSFAHIGFAVRDLKVSTVFYTAALAPLGIRLLREGTDSVHFGRDDGRTMIWLHTRGPSPGSFHISFDVETREGVQKFYDAALAAGGKDNGAPGIREHYSPTYYAAFVLDPDGHNIEAISR